MVGLGVPVLGFYPHTDAELRRVAEAAGVDLVVPRSRLARDRRAGGCSGVSQDRGCDKSVIGNLARGAAREGSRATSIADGRRSRAP